MAAGNASVAALCAGADTAFGRGPEAWHRRVWTYGSVRGRNQRHTARGHRLKRRPVAEAWAVAGDLLG